MNRNRPSDLLDSRRNSFGLSYPNNYRVLGTKGDVHTFFLILNDLIDAGILEDRYRTVSYDLYRTLVNRDNLEQFQAESAELAAEFEKIRSDSVDWEKYPYNRESGPFGSQQNYINPKKPHLADIFYKYFAAFDDFPFWMDVAKEYNYDVARLIVSPVEIRTGLKFEQFTDEELLAAADDPLWLREPG